MTKDYTIKEPAEYICESNYYLIDGVKHWRVTRVKSVLNKPGLNAWRARSDYNETQKYLHERANFGTKTHKLFELKCLGNSVNPDNYEEEELKVNLAIFDLVQKNCKLKPILLEQHLWGEYEIDGVVYRIAGTADYIGKYTSHQEYLPAHGRGKNRVHEEPKFPKGALVIGDWKTSPGIYGDFWLQLGIYVDMYEKLTGIEVDGAFILQMRPKPNKEGIYEPKFMIEEKTRDELRVYVKLMMYCLPLFDAQQNKVL